MGITDSVWVWITGLQLHSLFKLVSQLISEYKYLKLPKQQKAS
ncbi:hypothetical protein AVDCRST_MAG84-1948 [uncultured Microcoleus sp.]|uniref:Uncharacterized protein n=1 Tax=uncultured Microcoleus sp. TaxID=259945 RepID=A0A6J4LFT5_9CYAN|nr:hypothetical protein AVDCRST_MAG84-1948 [uncultured Microcoleus sp.]